MHKNILYSWNSIALNPESSLSDKFLDLSTLSIEDALIVTYPELSYCELIEVLKKLKVSTPINEKIIFQQYGFALDRKLEQLNERLPSLPPSFWSWCLRHYLSPRDLFPLLSLASPQDLSLSLDKISEVQASRSLGTQLLELVVECFLIGTSDSDLVSLLNNAPSSMQPADHWLVNLKALRFPQTLKRDVEKQKSLLSLPWTKDLQTRWLRQGDRSGVEVKFFAATPKELQKHVEQLQKIVALEKSINDAP